MQANSELKYVAPRSWCKAINQGAAVSIVNHNGKSTTQCKIKVALCNIGQPFLSASFILPTLAPQDRFSNYDVEAHPILDEFHVTHRPRLFLDSWGLNPKVFGLPRPFRQDPPALPAVADTVDRDPVNILELDTPKLQFGKQDDDATCVSEKVAMGEPIVKDSKERESAVMTPAVEEPIVNKAVKKEPATTEPATVEISAIENDDQPPSPPEANSDKTMVIDTKLAQSFELPCLSTSPEDKDSVSSSPNAKSPAASTPEKKGRNCSNSTAPTSAESTPEKAGSFTKESLSQIAMDEQESSSQTTSAADDSSANKYQEHLAAASTLDDHSNSLLATPIRPAQANQDVEVSTDCASDSLVIKADKATASSRYSMVQSALSFAQEDLSYLVDPISRKYPSAKLNARKSPTEIPTSQPPMESLETIVASSSRPDLSKAGPPTHTVTAGKASKKGSKKKQKRAAKKAKKISKGKDCGSNNPSQHKDQLTLSATAPVADLSSILLEDDRAVSDKSRDIAASTSTPLLPTSEKKDSSSAISPFSNSTEGLKSSTEGLNSLANSTHSLLVPPPTEEKVAKKGKAKKKNANRKAKRAMMFAAKENVELQHQDGQVHSKAVPVDGILASDIPVLDTSSMLHDGKADVQKAIGKEAVTDDLEQKSDISTSVILKNTQGYLHQDGDSDASTIGEDDKCCNQLEEPQVIDTSTMGQEISTPVAVPVVEDTVDVQFEGYHHDEDKTVCDGSTIAIPFERGHSNVLTANKEYFNLSQTSQSLTSAGSKAVALIKPFATVIKDRPTLKVIQAQDLFIPRSLLVPRESSRPIWKTRALVMHSKVQKRGTASKLKTTEAREGCKKATQITTTHDLSIFVVPRTQPLSVEDNHHLDAPVRLFPYNSNRLLTEKPWNAREDVRNLQTPTERSACYESPASSEKATPEHPINGSRTAVHPSVPQEAYKPHRFLSPGVASLIIKNLNATALRDSGAGNASEVATSEPLMEGDQIPCMSSLQQDADKSAPDKNTAESFPQKATNQPQPTPLPNEVSVSSPTEIYNPRCLLLPGETSWIVEKMNATASGDFDESELKQKTVEPAVAEDCDRMQLSSLDVATALGDSNESELKGKAVGPAANGDKNPTQPSSLKPSAKPKPKITTALEGIDIVQAAIAVRDAPGDTVLLVQLILVLVGRLVG